MLVKKKKRNEKKKKKWSCKNVLQVNPIISSRNPNNPRKTEAKVT